MRVLCGDIHPAPPYSRSQGETERRVCLSWGRLIQSRGIIEVTVSPSHVHYLLYEDCVQHLRTEHPPSSLTCSLSNDISETLSLLPTSFGTLVNLLADRYPTPDLDNLPAEGLRVSFNRTSVIDFILSGMLAVHVTLRSHIACDLRASQDNILESDLYQALFLDVITALWAYECYLREGTAVWSPMPWSRASLRELPKSESSLFPEPTDYRTPTLSEADLADEDDSSLLTDRSDFGCPVDVPWFGTPHDGYPFCSTLASYTKIRRFGVIQSLRDDAALWASAMTFGILEAVIRVRIPEAMLLVPGTGDGQPVLSGARILRLLVTWHRHMHCHYPHHADEDTRREYGRDVVRLLERAFRALDEEEWQNASMFFRAGFRTNEVTDMVCAVALTVVPLCGIARCVWDTLPEMEHLWSSTTNKLRQYYVAVLGSCEERMYRAGWCQNTISHTFMSTLWGISIVSNLIRLPPFIRKDPDEHRSCDQSACVFYTFTDSDAYVPRHVDPSCNCDYTKPPLDNVVQLLSEGIVPAVIYDGSCLRVRPAEDNTYVAISHVWADGMGSTTEVGLPTCQVARIAGLAKQLLPESGGAFWMDSLSVPSVKDLRKRAIKLMAHTYRDAAKVLVIDECIRRQCSESKSWEENLFRIATSGWVRRVWTLQEGLLARELYFEFLDGPVDVEERLGLKPSLRDDENAKSKPSNNSPQVLSSKSYRSHVPVLEFRAINKDARTGSNMPLDEVIRLLRLRSTTKEEDEIIAISSLLPLNLDALFKVTGPDIAGERMKECLMQLREVSNAFPMHIAPKLSIPGYRWSPRSLTKAIEGAPLGHGTGTCTEDGFHTSFFVAAFEEPVPIPAKCLNASKADFNLLISQPTSESTFMLRVYINPAGHTYSDSFDALLFYDEDLSTTRTVSCAAVCWSAGPGPLMEKDKTIELNYIAPCRLHRMGLHPDRFEPDGMSVMGDLRYMSVLLT